MYTTKEICQLLKINIKTFNCWVWEGIIKPTIPAPKRGKTAFYSSIKMHEITLLKKLLDAGMDRRLARKVLDDADMVAIPAGEDKVKYKFTITVTINDY